MLSSKYFQVIQTNWGPPSLLSGGKGGSLFGGKCQVMKLTMSATNAEGKKNLDLYIHSCICLHGVQ
jgi:hypothetical protein